MREIVIQLEGGRFPLLRPLWWAVWVTALYAEIFSGALRYFLHRIGATALAYGPKTLVLLLALSAVLCLRQSRAAFFLTVGFIFFSMVGILQGLPPVQVAFGATIFFPIVFGACFWPYVEANPRRFLLVAAFALVFCGIGLLWNVLGDVPWAGLEYQFGGVDVEGVRQWGTFGFNRPSGFARMSAIAAAQVMLLTLLLYPVAAGKSRLLALLIGLAGVVLVALTTSKAAAASLLLMLLITWPRKVRISRYVLAGVVLLAIALPMASTLVNYRLEYGDMATALLLASFDERLSVTWPEGISLLAQHSIPGFGRGLGGVGSGEKYFGTIQGGLGGFGVMDNYPLYLYGNFGVIGLIFLGFQLLAAIRLIESPSPLRCGLGLALGAILVFGVTTDSLENLLVAIVIGMALRAAWGNGGGDVTHCC